MKSKTLITSISLFTCFCALGVILSSIAWFEGGRKEIASDNHVKSSIQNLHGYFDERSLENLNEQQPGSSFTHPYYITRPVHLWNLMRLYEEGYSTELNTKYFRIGYPTSGGNVVYAYDSAGKLPTNGTTTTLDMKYYVNNFRPIGGYLGTNSTTNPVQNPFGAHIKGEGITISNLTVSSTNGKASAGKFERFGVFGYVLETADIQYLTFSDLNIKYERASKYVGFYAGEVESTETVDRISNCQVLSGKLTNLSRDGTNPATMKSDYTYIGHIKGKGVGSSSTESNSITLKSSDITGSGRNDFNSIQDEKLATRTGYMGDWGEISESDTFSTALKDSESSATNILKDGHSFSQIGYAESESGILRHSDGTSIINTSMTKVDSAPTKTSSVGGYYKKESNGTYTYYEVTAQKTSNFNDKVFKIYTKYTDGFDYYLKYDDETSKIVLDKTSSPSGSDYEFAFYKTTNSSPYPGYIQSIGYDEYTDINLYHPSSGKYLVQSGSDLNMSYDSVNFNPRISKTSLTFSAGTTKSISGIALTGSTPTITNDTLNNITCFSFVDSDSGIPIWNKPRSLVMPAADSTATLNLDNLTNYSSGTTCKTSYSSGFSVSPFTITFAKGSAGTDPTFYTESNTKTIRCYSTKNGTGNTFTISTSQTGVYITGVTMTGSNRQGTTSWNFNKGTVSSPSTTISAASKIQSVTATLRETGGSKAGQYRLTGITISYQSSSTDIIGSLTVSPSSWSGYNTQTINLSNFTITGSKNGVANTVTSSDYEFQGIGTLTNGTFTARTGSSSLTSFQPSTSENCLRWKAKYPTTAGGSTYAVADVTLTVTADYVTSLSIGGSMTNTTYAQGDLWNPAGLVVSAYYASSPSTPVDVTNQLTSSDWSFNPATTSNTSTTSVVCTASFGNQTANSSAQSVTVSSNPFSVFSKVTDEDDVNSTDIYVLSNDGSRFVGSTVSNSYINYPITTIGSVGYYKLDSNRHLQSVTKTNSTWSGGSSDFINNSSSTNISKGLASSVWVASNDSNRGVILKNFTNSNRFLGLNNSSASAATQVRAYATSNLHNGSDNLPVYLYKLNEKTLSSITLGGTYETSFTTGDAFNHTGMTVTANYSDNTSVDVSSSASWSDPDMSTAGSKTITVSYGGVSTTYSITVSDPVLVPVELEDFSYIANNDLPSKKVYDASATINVFINGNLTIDIDATALTPSNASTPLDVSMAKTNSGPASYTTNTTTGRFTISAGSTTGSTTFTISAKANNGEDPAIDKTITVVTVDNVSGVTRNISGFAMEGENIVSLGETIYWNPDGNGNVQFSPVDDNLLLQRNSSTNEWTAIVDKYTGNPNYYVSVDHVLLDEENPEYTYLNEGDEVIIGTYSHGSSSTFVMGEPSGKYMTRLSFSYYDYSYDRYPKDEIDLLSGCYKFTAEIDGGDVYLKYGNKYLYSNAAKELGLTETKSDKAKLTDTIVDEYLWFKIGGHYLSYNNNSGDERFSAYDGTNLQPAYLYKINARIETTFVSDAVTYSNTYTSEENPLVNITDTYNPFTGYITRTNTGDSNIERIKCSARFDIFGDSSNGPQITNSAIIIKGKGGSTPYAKPGGTTSALTTNLKNSIIVYITKPIGKDYGDLTIKYTGNQPGIVNSSGSVVQMQNVVESQSGETKYAYISINERNKSQLAYCDVDENTIAIALTAYSTNTTNFKEVTYTFENTVLNNNKDFNNSSIPFAMYFSESGINEISITKSGNNYQITFDQTNQVSYFITNYLCLTQGIIYNNKSGPNTYLHYACRRIDVSASPS